MMAFAKKPFIELPSSLSSERSSLFRFHDKISFLHTPTFPCQKGWDPPGFEAGACGDCSSGCCCPCVCWQWSRWTQEPGFGMTRCLDVSTQLGSLVPLLLCFFVTKTVLGSDGKVKGCSEQFHVYHANMPALEKHWSLQSHPKSSCCWDEICACRIAAEMSRTGLERRQGFFFFYLQFIQNFWWEYFTTEDLPSLGGNATI